MNSKQSRWRKKQKRKKAANELGGITLAFRFHLFNVVSLFFLIIVFVLKFNFNYIIFFKKRETKFKAFLSNFKIKKKHILFSYLNVRVELLSCFWKITWRKTVVTTLFFSTHTHYICIYDQIYENIYETKQKILLIYSFNLLALFFFSLKVFQMYSNFCLIIFRGGWKFSWLVIKWICLKFCCQKE